MTRAGGSARRSNKDLQSYTSDCSRSTFTTCTSLTLDYTKPLTYTSLPPTARLFLHAHVHAHAHVNMHMLTCYMT